MQSVRNMETTDPRMHCRRGRSSFCGQLTFFKMSKKKSKKEKKGNSHKKRRTSSSSSSEGDNDKVTEVFNASSQYQHEVRRSKCDSSLSKEKREASQHCLKDIVGMDLKRYKEKKASTPLPRSTAADTKQKSIKERKRKRDSNSEESETRGANKHIYGTLNYKDNSKEARQELHSSSVQIDILKGKEKKKTKKLDHDKKQHKCRKTELEEEIKIKHSKMCSYVFSKKLHMPEKWNKSFKITKKLCDPLQTSVNKGSPNPQTSNVLGKEDKQFTETKNVSNCCLPEMTYALPMSSEKSSSTPACWTQKEYEQKCSKLAGHSEAKTTGFHSNSDFNLKQSSEVPGPAICQQVSEDTDQEMQIIEELHAARNERKIDLTVVQSCGELTSMDVELAEEDPTLNLFPGITATQLSLLIVLDTNILLSHLQFIEKLKTGGIPGIGTFVLIIPWVVLQELDYMKHGKLLEHMKNKAIPAVHFIYNSLKKQDSRLWGQSMQLASEKIYGLSNTNNDDRVLQCCLQYQKLYPHTVIILCTDDKNLCSKALISGVKALCKVDLTLELQKLSETSTIYCVDLPDAEPQKDDKEAAIKNFLSSAILDLEKYLGKVLSFILETEMKIAFEELWMEVLYLKPPWTLADLLQCFRKHWIAVFGLIVKRDLLETVDSLYENLRKGGPVDYLTTVFVVQESCKLLHAFSSRSDYDGVLPQAYSELNQLLERILELDNGNLQHSAGARKTLSGKSPCNKIEDAALHLNTNKENKVSNTATSPGSNRAQEIWSILEHVWNTISEYSAEVFQKLNYSQTLLPPQSTTKLVSAEDAFLCLQKLMATVKDVLAGIQRILAPNSSCEDAWTLCNFLTTTEHNLLPIRFTAQELYECLSQREYREKLTVGCGQLAQLEYTMKHCHASVEAKTRSWM
ncbi:transcriptional protein SWT1 [Microcaecilia unicolor]|uniref:Transcriptional protein SWT1 n=1 Tax=Microcaecilia unicolor TaxID=1415580 RepID=A0A6P7YER4_9AMPH|nr:transcriptional protein SWT1 [Microcaecilia unicolor]